MCPFNKIWSQKTFSKPLYMLKFKTSYSKRCFFNSLTLISNLYLISLIPTFYRDYISITVISRLQLSNSNFKIHSCWRLGVTFNRNVSPQKFKRHLDFWCCLVLHITTCWMFLMRWFYLSNRLPLFLLLGVRGCILSYFIIFWNLSAPEGH